MGHAARNLAADAPPVHAPKVTKADSQINWQQWSAEDFTRRIRVFGAVWTHALGGKGVSKRVLFLDAEPLAHGHQVGLEAKKLVCGGQSGDARHETAVEVDDGTGSCAIMVQDGQWVRVRRVKVDGKTEQAAAVGLRPFMSKSVR